LSGVDDATSLGVHHRLTGVDDDVVFEPLARALVDERSELTVTPPEIGAPALDRAAQNEIVVCRNAVIGVAPNSLRKTIEPSAAARGR
jgi:hypothetical protein